MTNFNQTTLMDGLSSSAIGLGALYDYVMLFLCGIFFSVLIFMARVLYCSKSCWVYLENQWLEGVWTVIPIVILICIGVPSILLLYELDNIGSPMLTVKITGHQWYWEYSFSGPNGTFLDFNSYAESPSDLSPGDPYLYSVDKPLFVPAKTKVRFLITSSDVMHAFSLPAMGVKVDAVPGRINEVWMETSFMGVVYGQCMELCGAYHMSMPCVVEVLSWKDWMSLYSLLTSTIKK